MVTVTYRYAYRDYLEALRARRGEHAWLGRIGRYLVLMAALVAPTIVGAALEGGDMAHSLSTESLPSLAAAAAAVTAASIVFEVLLVLAVPWLSYRQLAVRGRPLRIELGEAVGWSLDGACGRVDWPSVVRVVETRHGLFLFVSGSEAFLLPRRALGSDAAFAQLAAFVRSRTNRP